MDVSLTQPEHEPPDSQRIREDLPYRGYLTLLSSFEALFFGFLALWRRTGRPLPERLPASDIALIGVATHKLASIVARDRATRPVRAPFTEYEQRGEKVKERPARGGNLRRAIGELLTCPFCVGPWIASGLTYAIVARPRESRLFAGIFASVAIADALNSALPRKA